MENRMNFSFKTKKQAEDFLKTIRNYVYKFDVITVNDVLHIAEKPLINHTDGLHYGYVKKDIQKLKPLRVDSEDGGKDHFWAVILPPPGRMVRGPHGYWTVEREDDDERGGDA